MSGELLVYEFKGSGQDHVEKIVFKNERHI